MLNLPIAMLELILALTLFFQDSQVVITAPQPGETLRGQVEIQGQMDTPNFASAELAFTFASPSGDAWFTIQTFSQPKTDSPLAVWDTSTITDGDYTLRLRVTFQDGTFQDALITDLKILNEVTSPTPQPTLGDFNFQAPNETPVLPNEQVIPTPNASYLTSTPLPMNPVALTESSIFSAFWKSALFILIIFAFFSLILRVRKNT
jgi:hypothetical protein